VLDKAPANATEVLIADNGKWEVSAVEDPLENESDEDMAMATQTLSAPTSTLQSLWQPPVLQPTAAELQAAAMNLGKAFSSSTPVLEPVRKKKKDKEKEKEREREREREQKEAEERQRERETEKKKDQEQAEAKAKEDAIITAKAESRKRSPSAQRSRDRRRRSRSRSYRRRSRGRRDGRRRSRSPEKDNRKMKMWEKLQGIEKKKVETRFGWLPEKAKCSTCEKSVPNRGGVWCGRKRDNGSVSGCHEAVCWACVSGLKTVATKEEIQPTTTKKEFAELGDEAWWMHEKCMSKADKKDYFGESEEEEPPEPPKEEASSLKFGKEAEDSDEDAPTKFAWE
jgi:hypothetical protein